LVGDAVAGVAPDGDPSASAGLFLPTPGWRGGRDGNGIAGAGNPAGFAGTVAEAGTVVVPAAGGLSVFHAADLAGLASADTPVEDRAPSFDCCHRETAEDF